MNYRHRQAGFKLFQKAVEATGEFSTANEKLGSRIALLKSALEFSQSPSEEERMREETRHVVEELKEMLPTLEQDENDEIRAKVGSAYQYVAHATALTDSITEVLNFANKARKFISDGSIDNKVLNKITESLESKDVYDEMVKLVQDMTPEEWTYWLSSNTESFNKSEFQNAATALGYDRQEVHLKLYEEAIAKMDQVSWDRSGLLRQTLATYLYRVVNDREKSQKASSRHAADESREAYFREPR